jgi:phospholipid transport system substrate-binding protein
VVHSQIKGSGDPIELDYRMEKSADGWKIYDVNVAGVWLVDQYRNSFAQEASANGISGLINKLADMNQKAAATSGAKG